MPRLHIAFLSPERPSAQPLFLKALKKVGAAVTGVGAVARQRLPPTVASLLDEYQQVPSIEDAGAIAKAIAQASRRGEVDRLVATDERHVHTAAQARELVGLPGVRPETARLCRDKAAMKDALRAAGVPVAHSAAVDSPAAARAFAERVGYPLILKPRGGFGALSTHRLDNDKDLEQGLALAARQDGVEMVLEEFISGHEGFIDTLTYGGRVVHEFISHYYPDVLTALSRRDVAAQMVTTNRLEAEGYQELRAVARRVQDVLGIDDSPTHMEWFVGDKGLRVSEIAVRPAGDRIWDLYSAANDADVYREWAHLTVHGRPHQRLSRAYSAGLVQVRPARDGRITGYGGYEKVEARCRQHLVDRRIPPPGSRAEPLKAGYLANAWYLLRHRDYDALRELLDWVGRTLVVQTES